jgi:hypothetical protein
MPRLPASKENATLFPKALWKPFTRPNIQVFDHGREEGKVMVFLQLLSFFSRWFYLKLEALSTAHYRYSTLSVIHVPGHKDGDYLEFGETFPRVEWK